MKINEFDKQVTQADIDQLEVFADKIFSKVGIDVNFTRHFLDRVNDERNGKPISMSELTRLFKQEQKRWGKKIAQLGPDEEAVMKDLQTDINLPFALRWDDKNNELDLIAKTVMRKKNFKTPDPEFPVEAAMDEEEAQLDEVSKAVTDQLANIDLSIRDWQRRWQNKSADNPNDMKAPQKIRDLKAQKAALMKKHGIKEEAEELEERKNKFTNMTSKSKSKDDGAERFAIINDNDDIEVYNNNTQKLIRKVRMSHRQLAIRRLEQADFEASLDTFKGYQMWYKSTEDGVRFSDVDRELEEAQVDEISKDTKASYLDKAPEDHYQMFTGRKPGTKHKLDKRRASIQKVSKELTGKKHFSDYDPKTKKFTKEEAIANEAINKDEYAATLAAKQQEKFFAAALAALDRLVKNDPRGQTVGGYAFDIARAFNGVNGKELEAAYKANK